MFLGAHTFLIMKKVVIISLIGCIAISMIIPINGYTLHKCCPQHQQLALDLESCVNYKDNTYYNSTEPKSNTSVGELKPEMIGSTNLPWWFPQDVEILDEDTLYPVATGSSFLRGNFPLQVKYGTALPCSYQTTQLVTSNEYFAFLDDGTLVVYENYETDANKSYPSLTYCVDRVDVSSFNTSLESHVIKLCPCLTELCLRKCCRPGKVLKIQGGGEEHSYCVDGNNITQDWQPDFKDNKTNSANFSVQFGLPRCSTGQTPLLLNPTVNRQYKHWVSNNGGIHIEKVGVKSHFVYKEYCAEITEYDDGTRTKNLVHCEVKPVPKTKPNVLLYGVLIVFGAIFLSATLVVYTVVPELRSLHGNNLMSHTASFLIAYISLGAAQLNPFMPYNACVAVGFVIQFSFLSAFFWLNVMCIDISWTFSEVRPPRGSAQVRDRKKFIYYSVYAWGSAGLISIITAVMEFTPSITILKPGFGKRSCLFNGPAATMVFFYIPMALLLITNLGLFLYTSARIIAVRRQTAILHKPGSATYNKEQQRLILYVKLFLLMGVTWVTEIISWVVGGPDYYWYLTDILNLLRAVFIFVIFCCKRTVYNQFKQRFKKTARIRPLGLSRPSTKGNDQFHQGVISDNVAVSTIKVSPVIESTHSDEKYDPDSSTTQVSELNIYIS